MRFFHHSDTTQRFDFHELLEQLLESNALPREHMTVMPYIAELISNIFEHSRTEPQSAVDWWLSIYQEDNELYVTVKDNGQGIESSLQSKNLTPNEPIRFAVESCFGNRGQGLRSIYEATKSGSVCSFKLISGNSLYFTNCDLTSTEMLDEQHEGVSATLSLALEVSL